MDRLFLIFYNYRFQYLENNILKLTARIIIIKNITSLRIPFQNIKYIINTYNPYVLLFANSYLVCPQEKKIKNKKRR